MTEQEYRAHPALNYSKLKNLLYGDQHFLDCLKIESEPTSTMLLGTLTHAMCLEPNTVPARFGEKPRYAKANTWEKENPGMIGLTAAQWFAAAQMTIQLESLDSFKYVDYPGAIRETPMFAKIGGVSVKCKPDVLLLGLKHGSFIQDIKTIESPGKSAFKQAMFNFGYRIQAGLYSMIAKAIHGYDFGFSFLVASNRKPFSANEYILTGSTLSDCQEETVKLLARAASLMDGSFKPESTFFI